MHETQVNRDYRDLIYTRLDLPQLPPVDQGKLAEWMVDKNRIGMVEQTLHSSNTNSSLYPWRAVVACRNNCWDTAFVEAFPQLVKYTELFPTALWRQVSLLAQLPDKEVFLHTDPDKGLGWRIYLSHGGPKLYFQKFKERHEVRPQTWAGGGPTAMKDLCAAERIYVDDEGCYPWALTATRAAHGVSVCHQAIGARVTMLLFPEPEYVDAAAHQDLVKRSSEKYADTAIWY